MAFTTQKKKTQHLIKKEMQKHERKITKEIKENKGSKKLWIQINKLKGDNDRNNKNLHLYDLEGKKVNIEEIHRSLEGIYEKHDNKTKEVWEEERESYSGNLRRDLGCRAMQNGQEICKFPDQIREHLDMCFEIEIVLQQWIILHLHWKKSSSA